jgi:hypothetical protein
VKESPTQKAILQYLAAQHIFAMRMNTGAVKLETRFFRFGVPGCADILAIKQAGCEEYPYSHQKVYWIECKATKGVQSPLQKSFQLQVETEGHTYILARSIDDVQAAGL